MQKTPNLGLIKPSQEDHYNIDDFNANADIVDEFAATFASGTTAQYRRGDNTWQDLPTAVRNAPSTGLAASESELTAGATIIQNLGRAMGRINHFASRQTHIPFNPNLDVPPNAPGFYVSEGIPTVNSPQPGQWFTVLYFVHSPIFVTQITMNIGNDTMQTRACVRGVWQPWRTLINGQSFGNAPLPTPHSGNVGNFIHIATPTGVGLNIPNGGSWLVFFLVVGELGTIWGSIMQIVAGGTRFDSIAGAWRTGWAWRIT